MFENLFKNRKPKGGKRRDPLEDFRNMRDIQQKTTAYSQKQFSETQRLLRDLQPKGQISLSGLDAIKQQRKLQQQQQLDWIEKGIETRQDEAQQRQQKLMEQYRQPIHTQEPLPRYCPPPEQFEPPVWEPPPGAGPPGAG